jgi:hypothetical protein
MSGIFWVNRDDDRTSASDGVSRYGYYVRDRIPGGFEELWDGTYESGLRERFARLAWYTATSPVMAPPYADWRSPVLSAKFALDPDGEADGLIATVEIASRWPQAIGDGRVGGRPWRRWPREHSFTRGEDWVRDPYAGEVLGGAYYALTTLRLVFPVELAQFPDVPGPVPDYGRGEVEETARQYVTGLVAELNRTIGPVVEALEAS